VRGAQTPTSGTVFFWREVALALRGWLAAVAVAGLAIDARWLAAVWLRRGVEGLKETCALTGSYVICLCKARGRSMLRDLSVPTKA
jgi:hypothetical protein